MEGIGGERRPMNKRVWFHRICAMIWIVMLVPAYLWWRDAIFFVIAASIYANVKSDWAASEAADDSKVIEAIDGLQHRIDALTDLVLYIGDETGKIRRRIGD